MSVGLEDRDSISALHNIGGRLATPAQLRDASGSVKWSKPPTKITRTSNGIRTPGGDPSTSDHVRNNLYAPSSRGEMVTQRTTIGFVRGLGSRPPAKSGTSKDNDRNLVEDLIESLINSEKLANAKEMQAIIQGRKTTTESYPRNPGNAKQKVQVYERKNTAEPHPFMHLETVTKPIPIPMKDRMKTKKPQPATTVVPMNSQRPKPNPTNKQANKANPLPIEAWYLGRKFFDESYHLLWTPTGKITIRSGDSLSAFPKHSEEIDVDDVAERVIFVPPNDPADKIFCMQTFPKMAKSKSKAFGTQFSSYFKLGGSHGEGDIVIKFDSASSAWADDVYVEFVEWLQDHVDKREKLMGQGAVNSKWELAAINRRTTGSALSTIPEVPPVKSTTRLILLRTQAKNRMKPKKKPLVTSRQAHIESSRHAGPELVNESPVSRQVTQVKTSQTAPTDNILDRVPGQAESDSSSYLTDLGSDTKSEASGSHNEPNQHANPEFSSESPMTLLIAQSKTSQSAHNTILNLVTEQADWDADSELTDLESDTKSEVSLGTHNASHSVNSELDNKPPVSRLVAQAKTSQSLHNIVLDLAIEQEDWDADSELTDLKSDTESEASLETHNESSPKANLELDNKPPVSRIVAQSKALQPPPNPVLVQLLGISELPTPDCKMTDMQSDMQLDSELTCTRSGSGNMELDTPKLFLLPAAQPKVLRPTADAVLNTGRLPNYVGIAPTSRPRSQRFKQVARAVDPHSDSELTDLESDAESKENDSESGNQDVAVQSEFPPKVKVASVPRVPKTPFASLGQSQTNLRNVSKMTIHGQVFCNGETFELVISELESGGTCYQRILFKVHAMLDATPPSESYLQGTMFFLFSDYVEALSLDQNVPQSAVCDASDAFLINPRTTIDGSGMHLFMVDLPVSQIIHIVRHLVLIFKSEHQSSQVVPQVRCQWVYTSVSSKQEYFTPILHGDEKIPPMPTQLSVGDFFCGAGGFSAGFRRAGFHIQLGVDEDLPAYQSWKLNHPTAETHAEEINDLIELKKQGIIPLPQVQIALISPPCQGFSTANPGGKNDEKNCSLLQTVADIAVAFQPYWICVENVPGLFRPQHRADLRRLEMSLLKLGYSVSVAEQCASNFGVPQTRRRLILFATQRGLTQPNFPSIRYAWDSPDHLPLVTLRSAILDLNHDNPRPVNDRRNPHYPRPHYTSSYFTEYTRLLGSDTVTQIANHATGYHCSSEKIKHWPVAVWDEPACTVRTSPGNRWPCVHPDGQRPLTVRELARIQSFPDDYHFEGEIKDQYRQVGNAVPPLLAEAWALELRIAILVDYPALADQFDNIEAFKPTSVGRKRRADELDDTAEGKGTKRLRKSEQ